MANGYRRQDRTAPAAVTIAGTRRLRRSWTPRASSCAPARRARSIRRCSTPWRMRRPRRSATNERGNKPAQIRQFYDELVMWEERVRQDPDRFDEFLPFIRMLNAKAAYAQGRGHVDANFVALIARCLGQVEARRRRCATSSSSSRRFSGSTNWKVPRVKGGQDMKLTHISEIKGQIELVSGLHIGSGNAEMHIGGTDNPVIKNPVTNEPYIPGSSLKGKMRSLLEWRAGVVGETEGKPLGFKDLRQAQRGCRRAGPHHPQALRRGARGHRPRRRAGRRDRPHPARLLGLRARSELGRGDEGQEPPAHRDQDGEHDRPHPRCRRASPQHRARARRGPLRLPAHASRCSTARTCWRTSCAVCGCWS